MGVNLVEPSHMLEGSHAKLDITILAHPFAATILGLVGPDDLGGRSRASKHLFNEVYALASWSNTAPRNGRNSHVQHWLYCRVVAIIGLMPTSSRQRTFFVQLAAKDR